MNTKLRWLIVGLVAMLSVAGCDRPVTTAPKDVAASPEEAFAQREGAIERIRELTQLPVAARVIADMEKRRGLRFRPLDAEHTMPRLCLVGSDTVVITEEDLRSLMEPFRTELEAIHLVDIPLTPSFLEYLATMPKLERLHLTNTDLKAPDFSHFSGANAWYVQLELVGCVPPRASETERTRDEEHDVADQGYPLCNLPSAVQRALRLRRAAPYQLLVLFLSRIIDDLVDLLVNPLAKIAAIDLKQIRLLPRTVHQQG